MRSSIREGKGLTKKITTIIFVLLIIVLTVSAFVYAFPSQETDCSECHGPSAGTYVITVTATPSKTDLRPGETYTVEIVIGENPSGSEDKTGYWIANSDASNTTGTSTGVYGGLETSHTYTATMTAPSEPGTYYYKVFGQDGHSGPTGAAGWDVYSITVTVAPGNQPPNAVFTYLSEGLTVNFIDQSWDPDGTITSWNWDFGDGSSSNSTNPTHTFSAMGTYNVILTVTDDQGDPSVTSEIIMVPSKGERTQLWTTQVALVSVAIAFLSFVAVGIARKIGEKEGK